MIKPIDLSRVTITTPRLTLRPWRGTDLYDLYEYASVDGVGQMAGWSPHENIAESKRVLESFIKHKKTFALEYEGKVVGSLGVEGYNEANFPELNALQGRGLGYVLSRDYWGRGLMPEAVQAVTEYLFNELGLDFILVSHFVWNDQSRRVIEKCGFKYIKDSVHTTHFGTQEQSREYIMYNPRTVRLQTKNTGSAY